MEWDWGVPPYFWPFFGVFAVLALAALAFDIWMLADAVQRPAEQFSSRDAKTWWIVGLIVGLVTGLPALAVAVAYFFLVRKPALERAHVSAPAGAVPPPPAGGVAATPAPAPPLPSAPPTNCATCGAKLVAGARFCHSCGTPVP